MIEETKTRLEKMTREEKERRFNELLHKHGIVPPKPLSGGRPPEAIPLEEAEEREWLKKNLGYA